MDKDKFESHAAKHNERMKDLFGTGPTQEQIDVRLQEIDTFCQQLKEYWTSGSNHHLRLGQLIINQLETTPEEIDSKLYNINDQDLINRIIK